MKDPEDLLGLQGENDLETDGLAVRTGDGAAIAARRPWGAALAA